jgi:hypothetical protein
VYHIYASLAAYSGFLLICVHIGTARRGTQAFDQAPWLL